MTRPTCLVLFDGAGLARLGLEAAGFACTGIELDPVAHHLGRFVGSGPTYCMDAKAALANVEAFDAVWASPPCQSSSNARRRGLKTHAAIAPDGADLIEMSLALASRAKILWVENVPGSSMHTRITSDMVCRLYNAHQFGVDQSRNRYVAGRYPEPEVLRPYARSYDGVCPCITATEFRGCPTDTRRASRHYGRKLTLDEVAHHMGVEVPPAWRRWPHWFEQYLRVLGPARATQLYYVSNLPGAWEIAQYRALGNGVPPAMAHAFGAAAIAQLTKETS